MAGGSSPEPDGNAGRNTSLPNVSWCFSPGQCPKRSNRLCSRVKWEPREEAGKAGDEIWKRERRWRTLAPLWQTQLWISSLQEAELQTLTLGPQGDEQCHRNLVHTDSLTAQGAFVRPHAPSPRPAQLQDSGAGLAASTLKPVCLPGS